MGRVRDVAFYDRSSSTPASLAALRHRVRTGRYRVAPERIAERMMRDVRRAQVPMEVVGFYKRVGKAAQIARCCAE